MRRSILAVLAGLLATAAFALTPGTALARGSRGGGGAHWSGGGGRGWGGGYYGGRGYGWGGVGIGIGLGYPGYGYGYGGYGPGYYGSGYGPYYYGNSYGYSPYYSGDTGSFYNTTPYYSGGTTYDNGTPAYNDAGNSGYAYGNTSDNGAHVRVVVPRDATVWFNDRMTKQTGTVREFETPALAPGRDFSYDVKAQWRDANGKEVTQTRHVDVRANSNVTVDFMRQ